MELLAYISLFLRFISTIIMVFFVLPKVWEETKVGNGLGKLRKKIFMGFIIFLGINIFIMGTNLAREIQLIPYDTTVYFISLVNSMGQLVISIIFYVIYHDDYGKIDKPRD